MNKPFRQIEVTSLFNNAALDILCIVETRIRRHKVDSIRRRNFKQFFVLDNYSSHSNGRIWVLWKNSAIQIQCTQNCSQWLHLRDPKFSPLVQREWNSFIPGCAMYKLVQHLKRLKGNLRLLHKDRFSGIMDRISTVQQKLHECQIQQQLDPTNPVLGQQVDVLTQEYCKFKTVELSIAYQRAKVFDIRMGDANSSYFYSKIAARRNSSNISKVLDIRGSVCTAPSAISKAFIEFYSSLLGTEEQVLDFDNSLMATGHWASLQLTYAGRVNLINSAIFGLEAFWCASMLLPKGVLNDIDKACRQFLWGTEVTRRMIFFSWAKVCRSRHQGGFGIREVLSWNKTLLLKMFWLYVHRCNSIWLLWSKEYVFNSHSCWDLDSSTCLSPIWQRILRIRDEFIIKVGSRDAVQDLFQAWFVTGKLPLQDERNFRVFQGFHREVSQLLRLIKYEKLTVPQRFFSHFYVLAVVWTSLLLLTTWAYAYKLESLVSESKSHPGVASNLAGAAPLSLSCNSVPEIYTFIVNLLSEFIVKGKNHMPLVEFHWLDYLRPLVRLGCCQLVGVVIFFWGWFHQRCCHVILGNLREEKENAGDYKIPLGDWFEYISSAHYLAEMVIYGGLLVASGGLDVTVWLLFGFVVTNLAFAATETQR
ncbi:hypothetical protein KSS87_011853 [Heliosperma pusillum]|nr:hypothetical protein KSS87_011853 [Heliosperma pusillum]